MKILAIGDIVGGRTADYLSARLWKLRDTMKVDFVVANGENATDIHGLSRTHAEALLDAGVDLITTGNHVWHRRDLYPLLEDSARLIRPVNYPATSPGNGYTLLTVDSWRLLCLNVMGTVFMEPLNSPFEAIEAILRREAGQYDFALMDIHAEATSEKLALARYFDGRIHVMFGTHTHVTTADEQILPNGSGYITDLGMSGPHNGILGTDASIVIEKLRTHMPQRFAVADGEITVNGTLFTLDTTTARVTEVKRITF